MTENLTSLEKNILDELTARQGELVWVPYLVEWFGVEAKDALLSLWRKMGGRLRLVERGGWFGDLARDADMDEATFRAGCIDNGPHQGEYTACRLGD
jgi:hypothetical protein